MPGWRSLGPPAAIAPPSNTLLKPAMSWPVCRTTPSPLTPTPCCTVVPPYRRYEVQDLRVIDILPQMVALSESYFQARLEGTIFTKCEYHKLLCC